jgi:hypothetical protein
MDLYSNVSRWPDIWDLQGIHIIAFSAIGSIVLSIPVYLRVPIIWGPAGAKLSRWFHPLLTEKQELQAEPKTYVPLWGKESIPGI